MKWTSIDEVLREGRPEGVTPRRHLLPGDAVIAILCDQGDYKCVFNPSNAEEVAEARRTFDKLRSKGFLAFKVDSSGEKGEQIREFDPAAGKVILAPPIRGGADAVR